MNKITFKKKLYAFTLTELLVVIAIIAILTALILPSLSHVKQRSKAIKCVNNIKQLNIAWLSYAYNNNGDLVYNTPVPDRDWRWIKGYMFYGRENWPDNVYRKFLTKNMLSSYVNGEYRIYLCPSDYTKVLIYGKKQRWVRSVALNKWMGDAPKAPGTKEDVYFRTHYKIYDNIDNIDSPSNRYTFLNGSRDTLDNGFFENGHTNLFNSLKFRWYERPARYHFDSSSVGFSDGHVEKHKWLTEWIISSQYDIIQQINGTHSPHNPDIKWLNDRSTRAR